MRFLCTVVLLLLVSATFAVSTPLEGFEEAHIRVKRRHHHHHGWGGGPYGMMGGWGGPYGMMGGWGGPYGMMGGWDGPYGMGGYGWGR
ncbi:hypothetical protein TELCIR_04966 [Teladorsagia circumcincta]|uniref:Uncharacterized protein n=1 Tax=Teladorsagia circumcincta TaxID=45464 RepID=A0A2G9US38_TELCI|nr:hypothetical protein TELCIR_04966 [Teladorsagia circumcincta]